MYDFHNNVCNARVDIHSVFWRCFLVRQYSKRYDNEMSFYVRQTMHIGLLTTY